MKGHDTTGAESLDRLVSDKNSGSSQPASMIYLVYGLPTGQLTCLGWPICLTYCVFDAYMHACEGGRE